MRVASEKRRHERHLQGEVSEGSYEYAAQKHQGVKQTATVAQIVENTVGLAIPAEAIQVHIDLKAHILEQTVWLILRWKVDPRARQRLG